LQKTKLGVIGLGCRGINLLTDVLLLMENAEIAAVCDIYEDRVAGGVALVKEKSGVVPKGSVDYRDMLKDEGIDAVLITCDWEMHIPIAIEAMRAGKPVGMEVGGAYAIEECWALVRAHEETGVQCMLLENCCYGRTELMILNMVRLGVFGDIVHCAGGYCHDLREEIAFGAENRHYRLRNYLNRNCENYPTHELGPIAKVLDIHSGNRMISLSAIASKSLGMEQYVAAKKPDDAALAGKRFAQGDVVTTTIRCAQGETIVLTLDTTLPRAYSRGLRVRGTAGMYEEETNSIFIDGEHNKFDFDWKSQWDNAEGYREKYEHPLWEAYAREGIKNGHGGMDWLVLNAFVDSVRNKTVPPIDVYDAAAWMSISALSEESIALGGVPVSIPDFTGGRWVKPRNPVESMYWLG